MVFSATLIFAQGDDCYRKNRLEMVLRNEKGGTDIFTTSQEMAVQGMMREDILRAEKWFVRDKDGVIDDVALLQRAGLEKVSESIQAEYDKEYKGTTIQFFVGLPIGTGMTAAGGYWLSQSFAKEEKPTLEVAGGMVLTAVGVGVIYGVIHRYIHRNDTDMYSHKISNTQVLDIVDRMNRQIKAECLNRSE